MSLQPESSQPKRLLHLASTGMMLGAATGLWLAWNDWGASWLWLPLARDRVWLFVRLASLEVPVAAFLGGLLFSWVYLGCLALKKVIPARLKLSGATCTLVPAWLLTLVPLTYVGQLLFAGGAMSRLPSVPILKFLLVLMLCAGSWGMLRTAYAIWQQTARRGVRYQRMFGLFMLVLAWFGSKSDQHIYPNLYNYLHISLSVMVALSTGFALAFLARGFSFHTRWLSSVFRSFAMGAILFSGFAISIYTLETNQNVRVALMEPKAPTSRSLLFGLEPLLSWTQKTSRRFERPVASPPSRTFRHRSKSGWQFPEAHVFLITIDALRADHLGLYGYKRPVSPFLDQLAQSSSVFEYAYAQAPHSSYSLCSLMTSEYLHELNKLQRPLPSFTLAQGFAWAGYHTAGFYTTGIFHTEGERLDAYQHSAFGFALHDHTNYRAEEQTNRVLKELDRVVEKGEPKTFIWTHYFNVHEPYNDTHFGKSNLDRYDSEILNADRAIQRLWTEAKRKLKRPIVLWISADHGEEFRDHGGVFHGSNLYNEQVRVPLILHTPDAKIARIEQPVELVDIAPSMLQLAGIEPPLSMRGDDLRVLIENPHEKVSAAFSAVLNKRMILRWPHKLISDLRLNVHQLYDLKRDPQERINLADANPEIFQSLREELYGWLDTFANATPTQNKAELANQVSLQRGLLGDQRAVPDLCKLVLDRKQSIAQRHLALEALTKLSDPRSQEALAQLLHEPNGLATQAAIALGRMEDTRAQPLLRKLLSADDPALRVQAALALGAMHDKNALPGLVEALWLAGSDSEREEAVRRLGWLRDPQAIEPLLRIIPDLRLRYLAVLSLGMIGDVRALEPLRQMLDWENHINVRENMVVSLGRIGDGSVIPEVLDIACTEPDIRSSAESLIRLGALQQGIVGGADIDPKATTLAKFESCYEAPLVHDWDYRQRTYCYTSGASAAVGVHIPTAVAKGQHKLMIVGARKTEGTGITTLRLKLGSTLSSTFEVDGKWTEERIPITQPLPTGKLQAQIQVDPPDHRVALDHILMLPCH